MGVTIHFEGRLRDESAYRAVLDTVTQFAKQHQWPSRPITETETTLKRVRAEVDWDYVGPTKGVELIPHVDSEPFRLEFDDRLYIQEFIKTQFAPIEVHIAVCELLSSLKPYFAELTVEDEGEYFTTTKLDVLVGHRDRIFKVLEDIRAKNPAVRILVRFGNGRIFDFEQ